MISRANFGGLRFQAPTALLCIGLEPLSPQCIESVSQECLLKQCCYGSVKCSIGHGPQGTASPGQGTNGVPLPVSLLSSSKGAPADVCKAGGIGVQVLLGGKPAALDTPWKPAKDTELILALVAAVQAQHWPVLESVSLPERFSKAWDFYLLVRTHFWHQAACMHVQTGSNPREM